MNSVVDPDQSTLVRIYTVCHFVCIIWTQYSVVKLCLFKFLDNYSNILELLYFSVIESHPDSAHEDLRLDRPFQGLVKYADSLDLEKMNKKV